MGRVSEGVLHRAVGRPLRAPCISTRKKNTLPNPLYTSLILCTPPSTLSIFSLFGLMVNAPIPVIAILIVHDPDAMGQAPVPPDEPHLMGVHHTHLYTLLPPLMGVHLNYRIPCRKLLHILLMLLILLRFVSRAVPSPRAKLAPSGLLVAVPGHVRSGGSHLLVTQ